MRPQSIIMFERLFLASLVLTAIGSVMAYDTVLADPALRQLGLGSGFVVVSLAVGIAIYLLLWFLIARRASNIARWVLVVFIVLGVLSSAASLMDGFSVDPGAVIGLAAYALEVAAATFLFRSDAVAWFKRERNVDPSTFD